MDSLFEGAVKFQSLNHLCLMKSSDFNAVCIRGHL